MSVSPMLVSDGVQSAPGDVPPDDLHSSFFREGRELLVPSAGLDVDPSDPEADPLAMRRMRIEAGEHRRRKLGKYVVGAVGASGLVCAIAFGKTGLERMRTRADSERPAPVELMPSADERPQGADRAPDRAVAALETLPSAASASPRPAEGTTVPVEPDRPTDETRGAEPSSTLQAHVPDPVEEGRPEDPAQKAKDALRLRETSRLALERGRMKDSIAAGENSVSLDPADGEAWLVLGAAYQQAGNVAQARKCFHACVERGKRGPRGECASMLR